MAARRLHRSRKPVLTSKTTWIAARAALSIAGFLATASWSHAAPSVADLPDLSLEELANIPVTSVSKREEPLASAPASIFVITGEDIRRSGATTLPEALRLAPNLQVAQVDARNYAITARGFNSPFENKLLVLIDGRTVYSPLFSGVFWDAQDVVLEDVARIEVISGAGGTLWGANAVNGVINIITKSSSDTQGALISAGDGKDQTIGVGRYGGTLDNGGNYRFYVKHIETSDAETAAGAPTVTGWHRDQAGFRTDWGNTNQLIAVQGDAYQGALQQAGTQDIGIQGANLIGRMTSQLADGNEASLQAYWDYTERNQPGAFTEHLNTFDFQFQDTPQVASSHHIVWGAGYRRAYDDVQNGPNFAFLPGSLALYWGNVFVQDEVLLGSSWHLTAGLKLEDNNYTGWEYLPTLRLAWQVAPQHLLWTSASRSVRTPSRIDRDFYAPTTPPAVGGNPQYVYDGGSNFRSEIADEVELGYRGQLNPRVSYSVTLYYDHYDKLRTLEPNPDGPGLIIENGATGLSQGVETWGTWQALQVWRLSAGLVAQKVTTSIDPGHVDLSGSTGIATSDPSNHWLVRSSFDIASNQEVDLTLRHSGALSNPEVPAYATMDLRYGWQIHHGVELSLLGQNLLGPAHAEFGTPQTRSVFQRSVFVKLLWRM